ncbi:MAG TPA: bifunctional riboflavin kinase/FAD synthetase, partial [Halothiobacillaceae bacterium]|nr:bifunctional riboflavin kinase/FAD synthetase [Halothiobacillaceae bacterium]
MKLIRLHAPTKPGLAALPEPAVVTVGNFDGVHCGHKAVIEQARAMAESQKRALCVLIFEPLPREYFAEQRGIPAVARLTRLRERYHALAELGIVDYLAVARFDAKLAAMSPVEFIQTLLLGTLRACGVVIGDDFRFGAKRAGDFGLLQHQARLSGFSALAAETFSLNGQRVSSTRVRSALQRRDVATAAVLLGRV